MLNLHPWKLLTRGTPINHPGVSWFNAVSTALTTMGVRLGGEREAAHFERPNTDGTQWNLVLPSAQLPQGGGFPRGDKYVFGWTLEEAGETYPVVKIHNCVCQLGLGNEVSCADTAVDLEWSATYVFARYTHGSAALTIQASGSKPPFSSSAYWYKPLYRFDVDDGEVAMGLCYAMMMQEPARRGTA